jgi:hypothetical protein
MSFFGRAMALANALGAATGVLSLVSLIRQGLAFDLIAPFQTMLNWYGAAMNAVFDPLSPFVQLALGYIGNFVPWDLTLHPHWKHVLVLIAVLLGPTARGAIRFHDWHHLAVCVCFPIGASVLFGLLPMPQTTLGALALGGFAILASVMFLIVGSVVSTAIRALMSGVSFSQAARPAAWRDVAVSVSVVIVGTVIFIALNAGLSALGFQ